MYLDFFKDAFLAAIAAIGFGAISRIPSRAYLWCGIIAAIGHSARFLLMKPELGNLHILLATAIASFIIGTAAVFVSPLAKTPAEAYLFPSLLPMIPGIYAYKSFAGLMLCILDEGQEDFSFYFYQFAKNGFITLSVILAMTVGAVLPIFIFKSTAFRATR